MGICSGSPVAVSTALLAGVLSAAALRANDWPQWRGPLGTGVADEEGLPVEWTEASLAWSAPLAGTGVSSPVVSRERIFVTSQAGGDTRRPGSHPQLAREDPEVARAERALTQPTAGEAIEFVVEAFHGTDGRRIWQRRVPAAGTLPAVHEKHNLATPSPVTDGETVWAWFGTGQIVALAAADGSVRWQRHLGEQIGPFEIDWGHGSSPGLHRGVLYLVCFHDSRSTLLAIDAKSGETRWQANRPAGVRSYSTPIVVAGPEREELVVNSTEGLHAFELSTGELLWHADGEHRFGVGVPSYVDGVLYATRGYRSGPYLALRPGGSGDVSATHTLWRVATGAPYVSSLLVYRGLIFLASDHGVVTAVDAATGETVWRERTGGIFSASPVAGDGKVYLVSETGAVFVYAAEREPKLLARNQIDGRIVASPALAEGRLYLRADDRLVAIGSR